MDKGCVLSFFTVRALLQQNNCCQWNDISKLVFYAQSEPVRLYQGDQWNDKDYIIWKQTRRNNNNKQTTTTTATTIKKAKKTNSNADHWLTRQRDQEFSTECRVVWLRSSQSLSQHSDYSATNYNSELVLTSPDTPLHPLSKTWSSILHRYSTKAQWEGNDVPQNWISKCCNWSRCFAAGSLLRHCRTCCTTTTGRKTHTVWHWRGWITSRLPAAELPLTCAFKTRVNDSCSSSQSQRRDDTALGGAGNTRTALVPISCGERQ